MFTQAIVRPPSPNFAEGLTTAGLGAPNYELALKQHAAYCEALQYCGLQITSLAADRRFPDSTFVEDTAIITPHCAILTRPGAPSRAGEITAIRETLTGVFPHLHSIEAPGTLDGGDICEADNHFFIGLSERTNEAGAEQLAAILSSAGHTSTIVNVRNTEGLLHLKSGISFLGEGRLAVWTSLARHPAWQGFTLLATPPGDEYAANCIRVNDYLIIAAGFPAFAALLRQSEYPIIELEMSEFEKMDGGLSCLSLRY